jgi:hypothetical protein
MAEPKPLAIELDFDRPEEPMIVYEDFEDEEDEDFMTMIEDETKLGIGLA